MSLSSSRLSQPQVDCDLQGAMQSPALSSLPEQGSLLHFGLVHVGTGFPASTTRC